MKEKMNNVKLKDVYPLSKIFKPKVIELFRQKNFSGKLIAMWKEGKLVAFKISTELQYREIKDDEYYFDDDFS